MVRSRSRRRQIHSISFHSFAPRRHSFLNSTTFHYVPFRHSASLTPRPLIHDRPVVPLKRSTPLHSFIHFVPLRHSSRHSSFHSFTSQPFHFISFHFVPLHSTPLLRSISFHSLRHSLRSFTPSLVHSFRSTPFTHSLRSFIPFLSTPLLHFAHSLSPSAPKPSRFDTSLVIPFLTLHRTNSFRSFS